MQEAFEILTSDSQVKAILVNILGGIVNCATIANGIVNACKTIQVKVPLIVRLQGKHHLQGKNLDLNYFKIIKNLLLSKEQIWKKQMKLLERVA